MSKKMKVSARILWLEDSEAMLEQARQKRLARIACAELDFQKEVEAIKIVKGLRELAGKQLGVSHD